jgi:hypothetical protein
MQYKISSYILVTSLRNWNSILSRNSESLRSIEPVPGISKCIFLENIEEKSVLFIYTVKTMLWICDILVRIRIRIRRSVPLTDGSGSDLGPAFLSVADKMPTNKFFSNFFLLFTFCRYIYCYFSL